MDNTTDTKPNVTCPHCDTNAVFITTESTKMMCYPFTDNHGVIHTHNTNKLFDVYMCHSCRGTVRKPGKKHTCICGWVQS
jgi:hypothetical protein